MYTDLYMAICAHWPYSRIISTGEWLFDYFCFALGADRMYTGFYMIEGTRIDTYTVSHENFGRAVLRMFRVIVHIFELLFAHEPSTACVQKNSCMIHGHVQTLGQENSCITSQTSIPMYEHDWARGFWAPCSCNTYDQSKAPVYTHV